MSKTKLFSVTVDDFDMHVFRAGGKGGQKQNKTSSGVRLTHRPSGAVAESREHRSQWQNKKAAFLKAVETPEFKRWLDIEIKRKSGQSLLEEQRIEEVVKKQTLRKNLKIEIRQDGEWIEGDADEI